MKKFSVTKHIRFDYGHRVPFHKSKCYNTHGHNGEVHATIEGPLVDINNDNDFGMVMDFSKIKELLMKVSHDRFDHKFLLWKDDPLYLQYKDLPGMVTVDFVPTAENLAKHIYEELQKELDNINFKGKVTNVRFFETPTSYADYSGDDE